MADWHLHLNADANGRASLASQPDERRICLVVAGDASRRARLVTAAQRAGWQAIACGNAEQGTEVARRARLQLMIVDLECPPESSDAPLRELTTQLATTSELLLIVCSASGNVTDEIWARQLGVWLYLPGLDIDKDLEPVCREAMQIATRHIAPTSVHTVKRAPTTPASHEAHRKQRPV